jgi:hypothetical protein
VTLQKSRRVGENVRIRVLSESLILAKCAF